MMRSISSPPRSPPIQRAPAPPVQALGLAAERIYDSYAANAGTRGRALRPCRCDRHRHPEPLALPRRAACAGTRFPRHLRQADDRSARAEAETLVALQAKTGLVFCLTHNYSGYPMVRQARAMVAAARSGRLRVVQVEYPQQWLTRGSRFQTGGMAHRPQPQPAPAAASAISVPMPSSSSVTSPD